MSSNSNGNGNGKRPAAWGTVVKHGDRFRAKKRGGGHAGVYDTPEEAWSVLDALRQKLAGLGPITLRQWGARWLDQRDKSGAIRSIKSERSLWRQHIESDPIADAELRRIDPPKVGAWIERLVQKRALKAVNRGHGNKSGELQPTGRRLSRKTCSSVRRLLRQAFEDARCKGYVRVNPVTGVRIPKNDASDQAAAARWRHMSEAEIASLFGTIPATDLRAHAFFRITIQAGLRRGEVLGLRWEDIHFAGDRSYLQVKRSHGDKPVKTVSALRSVPLLPAVREALDAFRRESGAVKVTGYVFHGRTGGPLHPDFDCDWRRKWRALAGVRREVRLHDHRHTCACHLRLGTWGLTLSIGDLKDWLGHSDIKTTLRYAKLGPQGLVALMERALKAILK